MIVIESLIDLKELNKKQGDIIFYKPLNINIEVRSGKDLELKSYPVNLCWYCEFKEHTCLEDMCNNKNEISGFFFKKVG